MTTPTREEIIDAHDALTSLLKIASRTSTASAIINEKVVRAALPPKPRPTMAEVEWDADKHYLAEAETRELGKVVMLRKTGGLIEFTMKPYTPHTKGSIWPEKLTPTGRRYTLKEVQE